MNIIIDGDACPVIRITLETAKKLKIPCIIVSDHNHVLDFEGAKTVTVDKGADSADIKIANLAKKGDLVITEDRGLAALALGKGASALGHFGLVYTSENIENLLYTRYINKKIRMSGKHTKGPEKRTKEDDKAFLLSLEKIIKELNT